MEHRAFESSVITPASLLKNSSGLAHQLLVAMPGLNDGPFGRSVIYLCAHSHEGAMGIVINQRLEEVEFGDLLSQLSLPHSSLNVEPTVHFGGPVETGRGFVLHSTDFLREDTVRITPGLCLTGTVDILKAISEGHGPARSIFALGYAGWAPGQLEAELMANSWLTVAADEDLIFNPNLANKWELALSRIGVSPVALSRDIGHA